MNIQDFITHFASELEDMDPKSLSPSTKFKTEIGEWDSLTALSVIAMVDSEYAVKISGEDIRSANTIEQLFKLVCSRK